MVHTKISYSLEVLADLQTQEVYSILFIAKTHSLDQMPLGVNRHS